MPRHDLDFSHGHGLPLCRRCLQPITGEQWAAEEECRGPLTCQPLAMHVFLGGKLACECGAIDCGSLADLWSMLPATTERQKDGGRHGRD